MFFYNSFEKPVLTTPNSEPAGIVVSTDTIKKEPDEFLNTETPTTADSIAFKLQKKKPVIIRKAIVIHDTVRLEKPASK